VLAVLVLCNIRCTLSVDGAVLCNFSCSLIVGGAGFV